MGNVLTLENDPEDQQFRDAEKVIKDEALAYKNRIAVLEAQLNNVSLLLSEKAALRKARAGSKLGEMMSEIDTLKVNDTTSSSNSSNRPRDDHQQSDFEAYTQAEGGAFMLKNKPPSFDNIYGADRPDLGIKLEHGYNPIYEGKKQDHSVQENQTLTQTG